MQPFLSFLILEGAVFYLAVLGDVYLTNHLIRKHGSQVEANPRVRQMYEDGDLKWSWASVFLIAPLYVFLGWLGLYLVYPYVPFLTALLGLVLPVLAMVNVAQGGWVFYRLRRAKPV